MSFRRLIAAALAALTLFSLAPAQAASPGLRPAWSTGHGYHATVWQNFGADQSQKAWWSNAQTGNATYFDTSSALQYATSNTATYSEGPASNWNLSAVTSGGTMTAPNGAVLTAIAETTDNTNHYLFTSTSGIAAGQRFQYSFDAKANGRNVVIMNGSGVGASGSYIWFDLSEGTSGVNGATGAASTYMTSLGNGVYRCSIFWTSLNTSPPSIYLSNFANGAAVNTNAPSYTGNGSAGVYIGAWQFSVVTAAAAQPTQYYKTQALAVYAPRFGQAIGQPIVAGGPLVLYDETIGATEAVRNNTMQGGASGTPGTLPTNWSVGLQSGLSYAVSAIGAQNGIRYITFTISGTASAAASNFIQFENATTIAASNGQTWTESAFLSASGATNIAHYNLVHNMANSGGSFLSNVSSSNLSLSSTLAQFSSTQTLNNASTSYLYPTVNFLTSGAGTVALTLTVGIPSVKALAFVDSPILTYGTSLYRPPDQLTLVGQGLACATGSNGWFGIEAVSEGITGLTNPLLFSADDGTATNVNYAFNPTSTAATGGAVLAGVTTTTANIAGGDMTTGFRRSIYTWGSGSIAEGFDGASGSAATNRAAALTEASVGYSIVLANRAQNLMIRQMGCGVQTLPSPVIQQKTRSGSPFGARDDGRRFANDNRRLAWAA